MARAPPGFASAPTRATTTARPTGSYNSREDDTTGRE
jgi:hypothetical protein